ncbi:hypothetical protein KC367_g5636 [Hortaea werneckii]|uniref:HTH CENPB-type domain-containing protein n=1 Tax=Hortaea werneckii TaxID=91943 RepID=A0A3M7J8W6_HORWE|nr:hypothetical protein KC329_g559 [Hortaea werneckii]KAI7007343.1 hypothetical protein KC366_g18056 [Hortaea werneckii]KAI7086449.1 hypothetical protein KC356_g5037 [Hortaea werneckii]KAI7273089.1 hypothetical protein KC335_g3621 [Hortaea werneckii]KAI7421432.1 hypothetical protein KC332_g301 [Hortaea werneckii]
MEATTILPFSAERGLSQHILPDANVANSHDFSTSVPSPFEHLVSELGKFVISQKALNITISDQALQQRARIIVYGEDDPWNQTAADNSQWLDLFKRAYDVDTQMLTELEWRDTCLPDPQDAVIDETLGLPWYWQSPECLASYRQNRAAFLASHSTSAFGSNDPSRITGSVDLFNATSACDLNQFAENASDLAPGTGDEERPMVPATSAAAQILNYAGNYSESQSSDPFNNISVGWENAEAHNG